ncbi:MAG: hypothetical protein EOP42_09515 [Sphingobacteriaceae bacterium]|nr:MAG: hypothetical protein EOP42_09515 [Sphingobacteriaceae bacterium]
MLTDQQIISVLNSTEVATAIHIGEKAVIQTANEAMLKAWGKDQSVIGKSLEDALPELKGQPFITMLGRVWREGITISGTDTPADIRVDGKLQTFYFDFEYKAVKNESGKTICILHTSTNITTRFISKQREKKLMDELAAINEELQAKNEELAAMNEEFATTNEELTVYQQKLQLLNLKLTESKNQLQFAIEAAEMATWDYNPATGYFSGNNRLKEWFGLVPEDEIKLSDAIANIHPKERSKVLSAIEKAMQFSSSGNYRN